MSKYSCLIATLLAFLTICTAQQVRFINAYNETIIISSAAGTFTLEQGQASNFTTSPSTLSVSATDSNGDTLSLTPFRVDVAGYTTVVGYFLANNASNGFNLVYFNESTFTSTMLNNSATNGSIPNRNWVRVINLNKILIDVYQNSIGGEQLFSYVNNLQSTSYVDVPTGTTSIVITPAGEITPTYPISTNFQPSVSYTIVVFGSSSSSITGAIYYDQFITPNYGNNTNTIATSGVAAVTTGVINTSGVPVATSGNRMTSGVAAVTTGVINTSGVPVATSGNTNSVSTTGNGVINVDSSAEKISVAIVAIISLIAIVF